MLLDEVLGRLRGAERGDLAADKAMAGEAADTIEMLAEINRAQEEQLAYYRELKSQGRLVIRAPVTGERCGTCRHYDPTPGQLKGRCKVRKQSNKRREQTNRPLYVYRSKNACTDYQEKK